MNINTEILYHFPAGLPKKRKRGRGFAWLVAVETSNGCSAFLLTRKIAVSCQLLAVRQNRCALRAIKNAAAGRHKSALF